MIGPSLFSLKDRLALITGSSAGIGFTLARGLAAHGATVILNGRDKRRLETARASLADLGVNAHVRVFDVGDSGEVRQAVEDINQSIGPIDILINNAGMQYRAPLEDFPEDAWTQLKAVNVDSVLYVGQAVARHMIARGKGKIVNICSVQSELARTGIAPYAATKGAVKMLTKGMATDWAKHGLQINGLAPGYFATEMNSALVQDGDFTSWLEKRTPAGRWGRVEELVGAAVFLCSDASSFVNGHILYVDGGITSCV
ncbi:gluconate 5-dehydrogenase [Acetobacter nitrogenifigens DSM 23921 = NBRC 105050]|uniref:Gluconate 5-dehydrogenase n=1 Tax=Acetobacter nitrogenifigens DSM 23921 = NBRC 105050 TaxID=1120919 RepID=A0A511X5M0_9PROT|nr:SDR family oxidoreductase [Acetobacter nitrogenifigens]GBQ98358.1 gluconate 5-dehydrogenase [Acetobacter nitrogenifigens DSM 23921 = NBRC 105050]GEN58252.1 gluconate 5-dehydrogenase [Acetobacter nitrogenifigens DSM 23921 = NBRC 105050]